MEKILWSGNFRHPKCFRTFPIEENFIYFRVFSYHLEIGETYKNATPNALIRFQNLPLKKVVFFVNFFGSFRISKVGW